MIPLCDAEELLLLLIQLLDLMTRGGRGVYSLIQLGLMAVIRVLSFVFPTEFVTSKCESGIIPIEFIT